MLSVGHRLIALLALAAVGLLAGLSISTSLALFSLSGNPQVNTIATGTVILESCGGASLSCAPVGGLTTDSCTLKPTQPCYYKLKYTGSADAWVGLYVSAPACTCTVTYIYSTATGGTEQVNLSPTQSPGPGATPDLLGEALADAEPPLYYFKVTESTGKQKCTVELSGRAVQTVANTVTEPTHNSAGYVTSVNPLGLKQGPGAWS